MILKLFLPVILFSFPFSQKQVINGLVADFTFNDKAGKDEMDTQGSAYFPDDKSVQLVLAIAGIIFLISWLIRRYIKSAMKKEKEKYKLRIQWYEQENKVLKAQMNPHFIFNSLNSIQQFIIANENKTAQIYLTKFARLIRKLLESNVKDKISVKEEIELCEKYLEIEALRFNNVFNYTISVEQDLNTETVHIPHFLIQVFIENAIWHGLLPKKEGEKKLALVFRIMDANTLWVAIDDNGIGRKNTVVTEPDVHKKSLAIGFVRQRLLLYSKLYGKPYHVDIIDKVNAEGSNSGTRIELTLPIIIN